MTNELDAKGVARQCLRDAAARGLSGRAARRFAERAFSKWRTKNHKRLLAAAKANAAADVQKEAV